MGCCTSEGNFIQSLVNVVKFLFAKNSKSHASVNFTSVNTFWEKNPLQVQLPLQNEQPFLPLVNQPITVKIERWTSCHSLVLRRICFIVKLSAHFLSLANSMASRTKHAEYTQDGKISLGYVIH